LSKWDETAVAMGEGAKRKKERDSGGKKNLNLQKGKLPTPLETMGKRGKGDLQEESKPWGTLVPILEKGLLICGMPVNSGFMANTSIKGKRSKKKKFQGRVGSDKPQRPPRASGGRKTKVEGKKQEIVGKRSKLEFAFQNPADRHTKVQTDE